MKRHVQRVHCRIRFVDRLVDHAFFVKSQCVEALPASMEKVKHRPYFVPERFSLLGCKARAFHAYTVYTYTLSRSRGF